MVQILKPTYRPGTAERIGHALHGAGEALGAGLGDVLKARENRQKELAKEKSGLLPKFNQYTNTFIDPKKAFDPQVKNAVYERAQQFLDSGHFTPEEAVALSWEDYNRSSQQSSDVPEEESIWDKLGLSTQSAQKRSDKFIQGLKNLPENIYGGAALFAGGLAQAAQFPLDMVGEIKKNARTVEDLLRGLGKKEIAEKEARRAESIREREKMTGIINPIEGTSLTEGLSNITGGRSIAQTSAQRILQGAALGPEGIIAAAAQEVAANLGLPESVQEFVGIASFMLAGHGRIPSKIGSAARKMVTKAETIGSKTGVPAEAILKEAEVYGGVDMNKVNEGNRREIKKLNEAISDIDKRVKSSFKEVDKFNKERSHEIRKETLNKLNESPLAEYYKPLKEPVTEAGKASKEAREAPVRSKIEALKSEIKEPSFHEQPEMARRAKLSELKDAEFELRNGRKPVTHEELMKQIETQHAQMREYIENPSAKKIGEIKRQFVNDRKALESAEKLIKRGELPGPAVMDEFIKIHHEYIKGYDTLNKQLGEFIAKNEGVKGKAAQVARTKELQEVTDRMKRASEARIVNQVDKRKALSTLNKPSGAFYKNMLNQFGNEVGEFEKQFFKVNRVLSPESIKTKKVGQRAIKESVKPSESSSSVKQVESVAKNTSEAIKEPIKENIKKLSQETGVPEEKLGDIMKEFKEKVKETSQTPTDKNINKTANAIRDYFLDPFKPKNLPKQLKRGLVLGGLQVAIEELTGEKVKFSLLNYALGPFTGGPSAIFSASIASCLRKYIENHQAKELRKIRNNPKEFHAEVTRLKNKYGDSRTNRVLKKMKQTP